MNIQNKIGSLEVGKAADMIAIDLNNIATQPVYDPIATIVYSASRDQVSDVWVSGKARVRNRQLVDVDLQQLLAKAANWAERIKSDD